MKEEELRENGAVFEWNTLKRSWIETKASIEDRLEREKNTRKAIESQVRWNFGKVKKQPIKKEIKNHIYLMVDYDTGFYKIGRSIKPINREETLMAQKPTIKMIHYFKGNNKLEFILHKIFHKRRIRGEWFDLTNTHVDLIMSIQ